MKKTCSICGKIHDINKICKRQYHKKLNTQEVYFRNSYNWKTKRTQIKIRDLYLCRVCLQNKMISKDKFNHQNIQVHHIVSIHEDWDKRLDSDNLISLCTYHHRQAEDGIITKEELSKIISIPPGI